MTEYLKKKVFNMASFINLYNECGNTIKTQ